MWIYNIQQFKIKVDIFVEGVLYFLLSYINHMDLSENRLRVLSVVHEPCLISGSVLWPNVVLVRHRGIRY